MFGLNSRASATTAVESMPLDRNAPTGTSERMCMPHALPQRLADLAGRALLASSTGAGRNTGR